MMNAAFKTLFASALCAFALISLASCSQVPEFEPALPDTETRVDLTDFEEGPFRLEFYDLPDAIVTSQRLTFRVYYNGIHSYGFDVHQLVNIRVYNPDTGDELSLNEIPAYYQYYFFTGSARRYEIEATLISDPTVKAVFPIHVKPGIYLKIVDREKNFYLSDATNGEIYLGHPVIHFFTDDTCKERIMQLPTSIWVRVLLVKRAIELFPLDKLQLYRDEKVFIPKGSSDGCSYRLTTAHQTLPSGEHFDDYYEVEFLNIQ